MSKLCAVVFLAAGISCGSKTSVTVTQLAAGGQCPTGGVQIAVSGSPPQVVCNGTAGASGTNSVGTLVKATPLASSDASCPAGGVRIESGLDNGAGGGIAGNGVLEPGEILSTQYVCNGDSGARPGSLTPPPGPDGSSRLQAVGGVGTGTSGGSGGPMNIQFINGSNGGHVKLFRGGAANAGFTFPAVGPSYLGARPAAVTASLTVPAATVNPPTPSLPAGALFTFNNNLYISNGTRGLIATGLSVAAGATLTFAMTPPGAGGAGTLIANLANGCFNAGTIVAGPRVAGGTSAGDLTLNCADFYGDVGSSLVATGAAGSATAAGGAGGAITLGTGGLNAYWSKGVIDTSGGSGTAGGAAGAIAITSNVTLVSSGSVKARGGDSLAGGAGGAGGPASLSAAGDLDNSGAVDASGGKGFTVGGVGGAVTFISGNGTAGAGDLRNSGAVTSRGGDVDLTCTTACSGGAGGQITLTANNGLFASSADLIATGGASAATLLGSGGGGGGISILVAAGNAPNGVNNPVITAGGISLSGNLDSSGGSGRLGGDASAINVKLDTSLQPNGQEIVFYGYPVVRTDGGAGALNGGVAGNLQLANMTGQLANPSSNFVVEGGGVVVYSDVSAVGGAGTAGSGGSGGNLALATQSGQFVPGTSEVVLNAGAINLSQGAGATGAPNGGQLTAYGRSGVRNSGTITAKGTGVVQMVAENGPVVNGAAIDVSGTPGTGANGAGSNAGSISLNGQGTSNSALLLASGGAGVGTRNGGGGGTVTLFSYSGFVSNTVAAPGGISVKGGAGAPAGPSGNVVIDGRNVTPGWTF